MFDELKREIDKNVVREENYKGEFYEISPYSYQRNRFKQGKIVGNVTSLKTTNNLFTYYFDVKNQIIEIREGLELKNQFYYTFFIYEKELMKTIAYDNSKRIVNVRYYLYGSNGKIEKMYSKGSRGSREETYFYENDRLQKIVIRQFDRNDIKFMFPDRLFQNIILSKDDFNTLRNMFDELKREIDKNVVREENYKGEFYEISPYSYQRNRFKQGKIVGNVTSLKTTNNLFTYQFLFSIHQTYFSMN